MITETLNKQMTSNVQNLYNHLIYKALGDRSQEWFTTEMFDNVVKTKSNNERYHLWNPIEQCSVVVRRAVAIDRMLVAMTNEKNSEKTQTAEILDGDLLLGVMPMGSNGLGKVFPRYLSNDELRAGAVTNRNAASLFGHNTMNYEELLRDGLQKKIDVCSAKLDELPPLVKESKAIVAKASKCYNNNKNNSSVSAEETENSLILLREETSKLINKKQVFDFYWAVKLSCKAVVDYANRFADLAEKKAEQSPDNKKELLELARIARKVPAQPAETFHEAMQSICFFHIALHASMNLISLGRLDQVLNPYLEKESDKNKALEVFECFILKCAGRINLNSNYLSEQDHVDYATLVGTHSYMIDQKAAVNNFLQNIIVGGKKPDGTDATNDCTYLILQAIENVNLSAPGIYVRLHRKSPVKLLEQVAMSIHNTKNNPSILNDEVMIPSIYDSLMQDEENSPEVRKKMLELANDYCVDGCWEPILNGKSDWTFGMLAGMQAVESALNQGASLIKNDDLFRGAKVSPATPFPETFKDIMDSLGVHLQFFVDQTVVSLFKYYRIEGNSSPSPLFSAYLDGCMEKGRDKSSGGAHHNLGGIVMGSVPDMVNQLAAIQRWVYEENEYSLKEVCDAIRENFDGPDDDEKTSRFKQMRVNFDTNSPKFGNNDIKADDLTVEILDMFYRCVEKATDFGKRIFQDDVPESEWRRVTALRQLAGYDGLPLGVTHDIKMKVTAGMGTFEQYHWMGKGLAASANRSCSDPVAPNFSPSPGTTNNGALGVMDSLSKFKLDRFAAGVMTDICLDSGVATPSVIQNVVSTFINKHGGMMTMAIGTPEIYTEIYEATQKALKEPENAASILKPYAGVNVRIGGWQSPFITLPLEHMRNYIKRPTEIDK